MGASFLITLREGLEVALVLAIVLAYLRSTDRRHLFRPVAVGAGVAIGLCIVAGVVFHFVVGEFTGKPEMAIEGSVSVVAAVVLTWMIFWMRKNARGMAADLHGRIDMAADASTFAVAAVAFGAVVREGFETVIFLLGAEAGNHSGSSVVAGGVVGLVAAAGLGVLIYRGGSRLNLKRFFQITGALLVLFAAGLVGKAVHEFMELGGVEGWAAHPVWTIGRGAFARGSFYDFLNGFFGWDAEPERLRVIAYVVYLVPVGTAFFAGGRSRKPAVAPAAA
jgi:high-affinity iron transporter